jgi:hypothetical protein
MITHVWIVDNKSTADDAITLQLVTTMSGPNPSEAWRKFLALDCRQHWNKLGYISRRVEIQMRLL